MVNFNGGYIPRLEKTTYRKINFTHHLYPESYTEGLGLSESDLNMESLTQTILASRERLELVNDVKSTYLIYCTENIYSFCNAYAKRLHFDISYDDLLCLPEQMKYWIVEHLTIKLSFNDEYYSDWGLERIKESICQHPTLKYLELIV